MQIKLDLSQMSDKQIRFFKSKKRFVGYGGSRGGGKSWSVRYKSILLALKHAGIKILILRRTYPDLYRNHIREMIPILKGIAKYSEKRKEFTFINGSIIMFGYCQTEHDVDQYQGQEFDVIFLDEATQFTDYQFSVLIPCIRGANDFPKRFYITCNPGGVGHEWVKRLFISKKYRPGENPEEYDFIPATTRDNKVLAEKDPDYIKMLDALPDGIREAWRDGNWDVMQGQYYSEFNRAVHVVEPFEIPDTWKRYRTIDYGLDCFACLWIAIDERGDYYVYREYAKSDKAIGEGSKEVIELTGKEHILYTVAPGDLWGRSQESAKSKADLFREAGLSLLKGSNNREAGWLALKELLTIKNDESRIKIFSNCYDLIEHIPALQRDIKKPTDCMTEPHEITHLPDALRYFVLQYTTPTKPAEQKSELQRYRDKAIRGRIRR